MRFFKFQSLDVFDGKVAKEFYDDRTYRVEYRGEIVGFLSRNAPTTVGGVYLYISVGTNFGLDYEIMDGDSSAVLSFKDNDTALIEIIKNEDGNSSPNYARLYDLGWVDI